MTEQQAAAAHMLCECVCYGGWMPPSITFPPTAPILPALPLNAVLRVSVEVSCI